MQGKLTTLSRRALLAAPLAVAAGCRAQESVAASASAAPVRAAPFKTAAPFPVGVCAMSDQFADRQFAALLDANFNQLTPEWEMKMEAILGRDGRLDFTLSDAIAQAATDHRLRLHATTLVWHEQKAPAFEALDGQAEKFKAAYRHYILSVAGRYRGRVAGWDVVNEPVRNDDQGYYDSVFSRNLGPGHIEDAFFLAREADPTAVLFLNDYNLEYRPAKRRLFLKLAERLLKAGAPLGGLGTQTHLTASSRPGQVTAALADLASLGLPIHVSELDVSIKEGTYGGMSQTERLVLQAGLVRETTEAFGALPRAQRYALTVWGVRDTDAWKSRPPNDGTDQPLLFNAAGRPKPAAAAFARALAKAPR